MSRYIDADKLKAEIKGLQCEQGFDTGEAERAYQFAIKDILDSIDSLQQEHPQVADASKMEQPESARDKFVFPKFLYARTLDNKTIDVSYGPQDMTAIEYVRNDFVEQEQPEVDLEKEVRNKRNILLGDAFGPMNGEQSLAIRNFARHFYELGLNARKDEL